MSRQRSGSRPPERATDPAFLAPCYASADADAEAAPGWPGLPDDPEWAALLDGTAHPPAGPGGRAGAARSAPGGGRSRRWWAVPAVVVAVVAALAGLRSVPALLRPSAAVRPVVREVGPEPVPTMWSMPQDAAAAPDLACGTSTATSFHDPSTASGLRMSYQTIASPYWPLGTIVKLDHRGHSSVGVVQDFGPAEWAVAQHRLPAIIDVSTDMMRELTGQADNSITVRFQVIEWGDGTHYRSHGTGRNLAYSCR